MVFGKVSNFERKSTGDRISYSMNPKLKKQKKEAEEADQKVIDALRAISASTPFYYPRLTLIPNKEEPAPQLPNKEEPALQANTNHSALNKAQQKVISFLNGLENGWMPSQLAERLRTVQIENRLVPPPAQKIDPRSAVREAPVSSQPHPKCRMPDFSY